MEPTGDRDAVRARPVQAGEGERVGFAIISSSRGTKDTEITRIGLQAHRLFVLFVMKCRGVMEIKMAGPL